LLLIVFKFKLRLFVQLSVSVIAVVSWRKKSWRVQRQI